MSNKGFHTEREGRKQRLIYSRVAHGEMRYDYELDVCRLLNIIFLLTRILLIHRDTLDGFSNTNCIHFVYDRYLAFTALDKN